MFCVLEKIECIVPNTINSYVNLAMQLRLLMHAKEAWESPSLVQGSSLITLGKMLARKY